MFQRRLLFSLSLILLSAIQPSFGLTLAQRSSAPDAASLSARLAAIEKAVEAKRQALNVPGVSLVIVKDDQAVLMKGFGYRDVEHHLPVTTDTLFAIGSCTKAFTGLAAVIAVDEGKLSLDDAPKKYLPYFKLADPEADAQVTLRDLLSHRTGLPSDEGRFWGDGKRSREEVIKAGMLVKPTAKLREKYQYNNIMFTAAGEAVARALNSTWEEVIASRIFKPLGMTASNTSVQEMQQSPDHALGYEYSPATKKIQPVKMLDTHNVAPAGAINSNAQDLAQWLRLTLAGGAINGRRIVSEKGFAELVAKQMPVAEDVNYGLGWGTAKRDGHNLISHTGSTTSFSALLDALPDEKVGWAILVNVNNVSQGDIKKAIREILMNNLLAKASEPQAAPNFVPAILQSANSIQQPQRAKAPETKPAEGLPTVEQILDKYVQAIGGKAAVQAQTSRVMKGTLTVADIDAKGTIEIYAKAPNKELTEIAAAALGNSRTGFNGTLGWGEENGEVKELPNYPKRQADFYLPLKLREFFPRLDLKGKEKIGEREAYLLEAPRSGNPKRWYFDTTTGLLLRTEAKNADGQLLNREDYEDYRVVNGMKVPFTVRRVEEEGIEIVIQYSEIKHNVPIDDAKFEKPVAK